MWALSSRNRYKRGKKYTQTLFDVVNHYTGRNQRKQKRLSAARTSTETPRLDLADETPLLKQSEKQLHGSFRKQAKKATGKFFVA